ncbi:hypothetical protein [Gordonia jacobaea]|uniref:hypothetical protein n=1 Tax=Gordonia jacobaea TaxID=122202 RepID=UPI003D738735
MNFVGAFTTRTPPDVVTGAGPEPTTTCVADASVAVPANGFTTDRDFTIDGDAGWEVGIPTAATLSGVPPRGVVSLGEVSPNDAAAGADGEPDFSVGIDAGDCSPVGWATCEGVDVSAGGALSVGVVGGAAVGAVGGSVGCDVVVPASVVPASDDPKLVEPGLVEPGLDEPASEDGVSAGAACE